MTIFRSDADNKYYFWLGSGLAGPFDEYMEAHASMTATIEEANGKEENNQEG